MANTGEAHTTELSAFLNWLALKIENRPILAVVGEKDELGMRDRVRASVAILEAGGVKPQYLEVPGGTHTSAFDSVLPQVFEFFAEHSR